MAHDEGIIKFKQDWKRLEAFSNPQVQEVIRIRNELFQEGGIGVYPDGIGYGNVSSRDKAGRGFWITGSQTGAMSEIGPEQVTRVLSWDIDRNYLFCEGPCQASSESLTHAMFYDLDFQIQSVIHIHDENLWKKLLHQVPTSSADIAYGTPEMAEEVKRLYQMRQLDESRILVMGGHPEGIFVWGPNFLQVMASLNSHRI